jgi:hypothetical protein
MAEENPAQTTTKRKYVLKRTKTEAEPDTIPEVEPPKPKEEVSKLKIKQQPTTIEEWAKARKLYPTLFGYTQDGDLQIGPVKATDQIKVIALPVYVRSSKEHVDNLLIERSEEIKTPEDDYTQAKRALQKAIEAYNLSEKTEADISEILNANQEVHDKECILNSKIKMPRRIHYEEKVKESMLTLNLHDKKNIADLVLQVEYTFLPINYFWMPKTEEKEEVQQDQDDETQTLQQSSEEKPKRKLTYAAIQAIRSRKAANYSRA